MVRYLQHTVPWFRSLDLNSCVVSAGAKNSVKSLTSKSLPNFNTLSNNNKETLPLIYLQILSNQSERFVWKPIKRISISNLLSLDMNRSLLHFVKWGCFYKIGLSDLDAVLHKPFLIYKEQF